MVLDVRREEDVDTDKCLRLFNVELVDDEEEGEENDESNNGYLGGIYV